MAGLIEKDIRLLFQKKIVVLFALIILLGFIQSGSFIFGFTMFLFIILAVSTISYDEFDNGYPFLMTLPITRKIYVNEKYLLCLGAVGCSCVVALCISMLSALIRSEEIILSDTFATAAAMIAVVTLIGDFMIPVQLKFGAEKSRVVLIIFTGILSAIVYVLVKTSGKLGINVEELVETIDNIPEAVIIAIILAVVIAVTLASYSVSLRIMNKMEF